MPPRGRQPYTRRYAAAGPIVVAAAGLLLAAAMTVLFVSLARDTGQRLLSPLPAAPADLLLCALAVGGALLTGWLGLGVVAAALSAVPGAVGRAARGVADQVAPVAVRRAVAFLLGTTLLASFAPGTAAGSGLGAPHVRTSGGGTAVSTMTGDAVATTPRAAPLRGLLPQSDVGAPDPSLRPPAETSSARAGPGLGPLGPRPPRPSPGPADPSAAPTHTPRSSASSVVVARGDTLWDIAARHLGTAATTASIAAEWPRWYAVNADLIGGDPDMIQPGQRLTAPPPVPVTAPTTPTSTTPTDGASR